MSRTAALLVTVLTLGATLLVAPASAEPAPAPTPPSVVGTPQFGKTLTALPGSGHPEGTTHAYQWLRDDRPVSGRTSAKVTLNGHDVDHRVSVRVTSTTPDGTVGAPRTSSAVAVKATPLTPGTRPTIGGQRRYRQVLTAHPGRWKTSGLTFSYRWYRDGKPITGKGATTRQRTVTHEDVGHKLSVRVTARKKHHSSATGPMSERTATVRHLHQATRTVTYSVVNDGARLDMASVRQQVARIYADARGWRKAAVKLERVARGGDFTLVLAKAERLPRYSSVCSVEFSCRVGRNVIINEDRWKGSTRAWRAAGQSIGSYRHMVVNHETGHWFGLGHPTCSGRGKAAPVMLQQSKSLQGCKANPFPLDSEARSVRR